MNFFSLLLNVDSLVVEEMVITNTGISLSLSPVP